PGSREVVMFRSLLVPLDGTPFGEHALPLAAGVARRSGAAVHLVHVPGGSGEAPRGRERAYLAEAAGRLVVRAPGVTVGTRVLEGAGAEGLADALLKHAGEVGADLLVLSSHGRSGLARWWLGSVADDLVRRTAVPLLLAHTADEQPHWEPEPVFR